MWKGILQLGSASIPVKLYAAARSTTLHLRLLHKKDATPVAQYMIHPETGKIVEYDLTRRGFVTEAREVVILNPDDIESLAPPASRDIDVSSFLPTDAIAPAWYERPYYLGPDGDDAAYFALVEVLERSKRMGLARWVMRKTEYVGALRVREGRLALVTLRWANEVVAAAGVDLPEPSDLGAKDLAMAKQLLAMLEGEFDASVYHDEYGRRLARLVADKAKGKVIKLAKHAPRAPRERDLSAALKASLAEARKVA
jgi:DNA end-binding protein Ku